MTNAHIASVSYLLPEASINNEELDARFPSWNVAKTAKTTGITTRHLARANQYTSDLAYAAAAEFLHTQGMNASEIEYLILCTQTPDFFLPTTAVLVHRRLGLPTSAGAVDVTLGCSGYVYSLGLAKALIESGQVSNVLVITADTLSKVTNPSDKSTVPLFGDAAAVTLVRGENASAGMEGFVYGTNGAGAPNLIVPYGGLRDGTTLSPKASTESRELERTGYDLYMDGAEIFNFSISTVPSAFQAVLDKSGMDLNGIDLVVFHQANRFMIEHLRRKLRIPVDKFIIALEHVGNTSSSSIPIALADAEREGRLKFGDKVLILGFGVGYSWAGAIIHW